MAVVDKAVNDGYFGKIALLNDGDTCLFSGGDHSNWNIDSNPHSWNAGEHYIIQGRLLVDVFLGPPGSLSVILDTLDVQVSNPTTGTGDQGVTILIPTQILGHVTVELPAVNASTPTQVPVATLDVQVSGPTVGTPKQGVTVLIPTQILGHVNTDLPAATVVGGTGDSVALATLDIQVVQPDDVVSSGVIFSANTQDVAVSQPSNAVSVPVGDQVMWIYSGTDWLSLQTHTIISGFSNTSPYTGDEFAVYGGVTTDANSGFRMRRRSRFLTISAQSDGALGSPPSSSCSVQLFVDGVTAATLSWDGSSYGAEAVAIDVDVGDGSYVTFKYVDDAGGQSAGKVVVVAEYRWRRG